MFITVKYGRLIFTATTLLLAISFAFIVFGGKNASVSSFGTPVAKKVIVIDPGHGGPDAGAEANGALEKDLNLKVAQYLKEFIEENGGTVVMTRTTDTNTAAPNRDKRISQKKSDLTERKNLPQKVDADIFISIHMNKFTESKYKGAQVFCAPNSQESMKLGETIQASLIKNADPNNTRIAKEGSSIYILKNAKIPSVLVECGFLSNAEEAELLQTDSYQRKVAWAIFMGVSQYLTEN